MAHSWIVEAARLLSDSHQCSSDERRRAYRALFRRVGREGNGSPFLREAAAQFRKVTKSYWRGLFACYETSGLPRTNNELEHLFGSLRISERRTNGRKVASPALVIRGQVRLLATLASERSRLTPADLRPKDITAWREIRSQLELRQEARRMQRRFRNDPETYLRAIEDRLIQRVLPP
jgi:hypothetical protein